MLIRKKLYELFLNTEIWPNILSSQYLHVKICST
jgi:hypothetical protein